LRGSFDLLILGRHDFCVRSFHRFDFRFTLMDQVKMLIDPKPDHGREDRAPNVPLNRA
jgi:hypothetical protein